MHRTLPIARLLAAALALGLGIACTNSGLADQVDTDTDDPTATGPTNTGTGSGSCDFTGTWVVSNVWCSTFDINNDWFAVYTNAEMVIADSGAGDGSCTVNFSWNNADCAEEETWEITSTAAQSWSIRFGGIESCAPDQCTFFPSDDTCLVGDRTQATPLEFDVEVLQPTQIRITGLFGDETVWVESGYPQCTLDLITEWIKQ